MFIILQIAKQLNIPHIIRGSAGSSLICFLMGITDIDPVLYKLELARFMNEGRVDLPDIDIDVPYNRRSELYNEISKQWPGMVARISNHVKYGMKVALRETAKQVIRESVPLDEQKKKIKIVQRKKIQLSKVFSEEKEKEVMALAKEKKGTFKNYSKHCGGIVIFQDEGAIPKELLLDSKSELEQICLNKDETEEAGYIKIDVLSNRGLAQLVDSQVKPISLLEYPSRDSKTEALFARGDTIGITFGESRGMRKLFIAIKPRFMEDVAIALALIRPAAAMKGRKAEFLERWKHGMEDIEAPEYRQIIYDDDAISMIRDLLHCRSAEADKWRKVFAKQNPAGRIQFRKELYKRKIANHIQEHIIEELDYLSLYSFCKSHAISYAQLVWALAYEKAHNPHRFWCSSLNHCNSEYRKWVHYREARCSGLQLSREKPPYQIRYRKEQATLVNLTKNEQILITDMFTKKISREEQDIYDMKEYGYWLSESFLPNCGIWPESQQSLAMWFGTRKEQNQKKVKFRGLIATGRVIRRDGLVTLLTIGIGNKHYIDLVYPNKDCAYLFQSFIVEGSGVYQKENDVESIQIESIHTISLDTLLEKSR